MIYKKSIKVTIFFTEVICMLLEVCASYLFSPYFGTSNFVWTGIIGVILLSNSIGNFIGGRLIQKKDKEYVPTIFLIASACTFLLGIMNNMVCYGMFLLCKNIPVASIVSSLILLLPAEICLGTIPPQIMAKSTDKDNKEIGLIYMLSTIGGLSGTFIGGFLLIPNIGVNMIVILCGIVLLVLGFSSFPITKKSAVLYIICLILMVINIKEVIQKDNTVFDLNANDKTTLVVDSEYNRIIIGDTIANGKPARFMNMALGFQSATYTDEADRYEMVFDYIKGFDQTVDLGTHRTNMLMIGGAAYQYPKYVLAHRQDSTMDVVEIDEKVTELAKEYFYLQDCIDQYDPDHNRLGLYTQDAKIYINECQKKYDIIFNDAFSGTVPPRTLTTLETIQKIAETLNKDGIYVINIVQETGNLDFLKAECHTLSVEFPYIYVKQLTSSNYRVIASFMPLNTENMDLDYSESILLTDNYCPIESLISMPDVEIEDENDDK